MTGELMDMSGGRLTRFLVRPLIINASQASKAAKRTHCIDHSVMLAIAKTKVFRLAPGEHKPPGTTFVGRIKAVDVDTRIPVDLAFDENQQPVDAGKLLAAVEHRRFQKFGRIDEALWRRVHVKPAEETIDVVVWPRITKSVATHEKRGPKDQMPHEERRLLDQISAMRDSILQTVR